MKYTACSVRDSAVDQYNRPFFALSDGDAIRSFTDEVNRAESPMGAHAPDYVLFKLGTFDGDTGLFDTVPPIQLMRAVDALRTSNAS